MVGPPEYFSTPFMVGLAWKNSAECFAVGYLAIKKIMAHRSGKITDPNSISRKIFCTNFLAFCSL